MKREICLKEMQLAAEALLNNPKSYTAWHHRKWIVQLGWIDIKSEFDFVERRLEDDSRNFHAWNYRQFLVKKSERSPQQELEFSQMKIEQNFSNYSAWHHRRRCLDALYQPIVTISFTDLLADKAPSTDQDSSAIPLEILELELRTTHSAFVTDPDDSSAWIYYRWLIAQVFKLRDPDQESSNVEKALNEEVSFFKSDLLELDPESKWILLTYVMLLEVKSKLDGSPSPEVSEIYSKLTTIDPMRKGFYKDVRDGQASILMDI